MRKKIKDLEEGLLPLQSFVISDFKISDTKAGKPFLSFSASDRTGKIGCKFWDWGTVGAPAQERLRSYEGKVVNVAGIIDSYNGKLQLKIENIDVCENPDMGEFEAISKYPLDEMVDKLGVYVTGFNHPYFKTVAAWIFDKYNDRFYSAPAATGMHHAFKHGLLEHTLQMLETGWQLFKLPYYAEALNKDLCMFGLMFHDFGKIFEYGPGPDFKKTISGIKVPHIPKMGAIIYHVCQTYSIPEDVSDEMMSIVLSHHRSLSWGSPVTPSSPEALFVHYIDNLHGDVFGTTQALEKAQPGEDRVKHGFGADAYTLPVRRMSDILKMEVSDESESF